MSYPIDATFLDKDFKPVKTVRNIRPWRPFIWGGWRARSVLETAATCARALLFAAMVALGTTAAAAPADGGLYCVIDLSAGPKAAKYPVLYTDTIPGGNWGDEFKTKKLVLRRIAGDKPFYLGVFEVTQKQYELVMGGNPSYYKGDLRPVENVSCNELRGAYQGAEWPQSAEVDYFSFLGKLRARSGLSLDLPTEDNWQYASLAGKASGDEAAAMNTLGRYRGNQGDGKGASAVAHARVGSYAPNAWGLYDMHGNVWEWCLESASTGRILRGGCWLSEAYSCTSSSRIIHDASICNSCIGFRLYCPAAAR